MNDQKEFEEKNHEKKKLYFMWYLNKNYVLLQAFTNPSPDFKTIEECNHMLSIPLNSILQISINVHLFRPYMILIL